MVKILSILTRKLSVKKNSCLKKLFYYLFILIECHYSDTESYFIFCCFYHLLFINDIDLKYRFVYCKRSILLFIVFLKSIFIIIIVWSVLYSNHKKMSNLFKFLKIRTVNFFWSSSSIQSSYDMLCTFLWFREQKI